MTRNLPLVTAIAALATFAALVLAGMAANGWAFEYPLDDVYIHLAMAEQWFQGGYGVNAGEYASAASSFLYPALLPPIGGAAGQVWLPLVWSIVFLLTAAWLIGEALQEADLGSLGLAFAVAAPLALTIHVVAFAGMENMGHGAASLAIVLGLWRFVNNRRLGWLLIFGILLAPALRLEGLALALAASGVVFLLGRPGAGLALGLLAFAPVAGFSAWLMSLGLDPLPNSVNAKLPDPTEAEAGVVAGIGGTFFKNAGTYGGRYVLGLIALVLLAAITQFSRKRADRGLVALAVVAAALAHLAVASTGWLDRYENYLVVSLFAVLALSLADSARMVKSVLIGGALIGGIVTYLPFLDNRIANPRAIHLQQAEMSRFAKEHVKAPVAVNDLGWVAWGNPNHVLDLWGLASAKALKTRQGGAAPGWADALADEKGVGIAMIYDRWVREALGPDWVRLGELVLERRNGALLGGATVGFYARNAEEAARIAPELGHLGFRPAGRRAVRL